MTTAFAGGGTAEEKNNTVKVEDLKVTWVEVPDKEITIYFRTRERERDFLEFSDKCRKFIDSHPLPRMSMQQLSRDQRALLWNDEHCARVFVLFVQDGNRSVRVSLIDSGEKLTVSPFHLYQLPAPFENHMPFIETCRLAGLPTQVNELIAHKKNLWTNLKLQRWWNRTVLKYVNGVCEATFFYNNRAINPLLFKEDFHAEAIERACASPPPPIISSLMSTLCAMEELSADERVRHAASRLPWKVHGRLVHTSQMSANGSFAFSFSNECRNFEAFSASLNAHYSQRKTELLTNAHVGSYCAFYAHPNWLRGVVLRVAAQHCLVAAIDTGLEQFCPHGRLHKLAGDFFELPFALRCVYPRGRFLLEIGAPPLSSFDVGEDVVVTIMSAGEPCIAVVESADESVGERLIIDRSRLSQGDLSLEWDLLLNKPKKGLPSLSFKPGPEPTSNDFYEMVICRFVSSTDFYVRDIAQILRVAVIRDILIDSYADTPKLNKLKFESTRAMTPGLACAVYSEEHQMWTRSVVTKAPDEDAEGGVTLEAMSVDYGWQMDAIPLFSTPSRLAMLRTNLTYPAQLHRVAVNKSSLPNFEYRHRQKIEEEIMRELLPVGTVVLVKGIAPRKHANLDYSAPVVLKLQQFEPKLRDETIWQTVERIYDERQAAENIAARRRSPHRPAERGGVPDRMRSSTPGPASSSPARPNSRQSNYQQRSPQNVSPRRQRHRSAGAPFSRNRQPEQPVVSQRSPPQDGIGLAHNQQQQQQQQQQRPSPPRMTQQLVRPQFRSFRGAPPSSSLRYRGPPPTPSPPFRGPSPILPSPPQEILPRRQRHHSTGTSMREFGSNEPPQFGQMRGARNQSPSPRKAQPFTVRPTGEFDAGPPRFVAPTSGASGGPRMRGFGRGVVTMSPERSSLRISPRSRAAQQRPLSSSYSAAAFRQRSAGPSFASNHQRLPNQDEDVEVARHRPYTNSRSTSGFGQGRVDEAISPRRVPAPFLIEGQRSPSLEYQYGDQEPDHFYYRPMSRSQSGAARIGESHAVPSFLPQQHLAADIEQDFLNRTVSSVVSEEGTSFSKTCRFERAEDGTPRAAIPLGRSSRSVSARESTLEDIGSSSASSNVEELPFAPRQRVQILTVRSASEIFLHTGTTKKDAVVKQAELQDIYMKGDMPLVQTTHFGELYVANVKGIYCRVKMLRQTDEFNVEVELVDSGTVRELPISTEFRQLPKMLRYKATCLGPCRLAGDFPVEEWLSLDASNHIRALIDDAGNVEAELRPKGRRYEVTLWDMTSCSINEQFGSSFSAVD